MAELAQRADCTPDWLADAERGAFSPAWSEIGLLAQALDLRLSTFIAEIELESRAGEL